MIKQIKRHLKFGATLVAVAIAMASFSAYLTTVERTAVEAASRSGDHLGVVIEPAPGYAEHLNFTVYLQSDYFDREAGWTGTGPARVHVQFNDTLPLPKINVDINVTGELHNACNDGRLVYDDFFEFGADKNERGSNFMSDLAGNGVGTMLPGGEQCAFRVGSSAGWHGEVCIEYDGIIRPSRIDERGVAHFDTWDHCRIISSHEG